MENPKGFKISQYACAVMLIVSSIALVANDMNAIDGVRLSQHFLLREFLNLNKYPENIPTMQVVANLTYGVSVSVFPHCSIARKLLPLHPCIKKCTIMDAKKDYSHVISGYRNELRLNGKATLSAYCRSVGVSISAVHHWMENYGITTKKIKAEMAEFAGSDSPFVPLSSEMPVPVRSSSRIELTFPNGVLLSADQYPPQDLLVLLNGYRGGRV